MKTDRHSPRAGKSFVKLTDAAPSARPPTPRGRPLRRAVFLVLVGIVAASTQTAAGPGMLFAQEFGQAQGLESSAAAAPATLIETDFDDSLAPELPADNARAAKVAPETSDPRAVGLLQRVLTMLVHGPAFHTKVRETVWTNGREVVGVGTYEQAGGGSGRFHLQVTMHDGDGKHRLQQISDGRLAWTRTEIDGRVSLRRVDVGRLDEWVGESSKRAPIAPRFTVGAWTEMLNSVDRDYVLAVVGARLNEEPLWVLTGSLRADQRAKILADSGRSEWPMLYPTRVHIAIRSKPDPDTGFGAMLPVRIEFWSDPADAHQSGGESNSEVNKVGNGGRLITLIELYSIQPITTPPLERFRFENQDAEVNFINETDRYIQLFGVHLTERDRRQLRR